MNYKRLYLDSPEFKQPEPGNNGYDLCAYGEYTIKPYAYVKVATGIAVELPDGTCGVILGRSGNTFRLGLLVAHNGLIDEGYRGEIFVLLHNTSDETLRIEHEHRIAQLLLIPTVTPRVVEVTELSTTPRGDKWQGSSGLGALLFGEEFLRK